MRDQKTITALNGVTTGTSNVFSLADVDQVGLDCNFSSGASAGVVALERAPTADYAGTWDTLATIDVTALASPPVTSGQAVPVTGGFARVRVTTTVSGGTVTAYLNATRLN